MNVSSETLTTPSAPGANIAAMRNSGAPGGHSVHQSSPALPADAAVPLQTVDRMMTVKEVMAVTSYARSTIYRQMAKGEFPRPVRLGKQGPKCKVAFRASDIIAWLDSRQETEPMPAAAA
jgi:prophage regulatory protein